MNIDRRRFLQAGLAAAAACGLGQRLDVVRAAGEAPAPEKRSLQEIGIIGGVPEDMKGDWRKSLRRMAEIGYRVLEGGPRRQSPGDFLKFLEEIKLKLVSSGVGFGKKLPQRWLDAAKALHAEYGVVFSPWFHPPEKLTLDELKEIADALNEAGRQAKAAGVKLAFHNHYQEFRPLDGKPIFDRLLDLTQPDLVSVEMDLCWVVRGGADPVDYFKRYPGRFELLHVKDLGKAPDYEMVPVGAGTIDFARIFAACPASVKHFIVELEGKANTMKAAEESHRYLSGLKF